MKTRILAIFLLTFICNALCSQSSRVVEELNTILVTKAIPGIHMTVIHNGKSQTYTAGLADVEKTIPMKASDRMLLGSVGKSFFAALTLRLEEKGILNTNDLVMKYLGNEEWFKNIPYYEFLSIRNLLNHTSGIPEYVYSQELWQTIKNDPQKQWTVKDRMSLIAGSENRFAPNEGWSYADANYIVLGAVLEKVTGQDVYGLVQSHFTIPMNLKSIEPSITQNLEGITAGYSGNFFGNLFGEKISNIGKYGLNPQFEWTGGGFITRSNDLAKWIDGLYKGKVLSHDATDKMFTPVNRMSGKLDKTGYGLGSEIFNTRYGKAYGHTGFMPGFTTMMAHLPDHDLSIAFQINIDPFSLRLMGNASTFVLLDQILPLFIQKDSTAIRKEDNLETKLILVRHAETNNDGSRNPDLSQKGKERAKRLMHILANENISDIYASPYTRTRGTAQPLADKLNLKVKSYNPSEVTTVFDIIADCKGKTVVIIGHSNTIPSIINLISRTDDYERIDENDYSNIFTLHIKNNRVKIDKSTY